MKDTGVRIWAFPEGWCLDHEPRPRNFYCGGWLSREEAAVAEVMSS